MENKIYEKLTEAGHKLRLRDGEVDEFVCDVEFHNGPACELCGQSWCVWCLLSDGAVPKCKGGA